jgi:hypothetical protein
MWVPESQELYYYYFWKLPWTKFATVSLGKGNKHFAFIIFLEAYDWFFSMKRKTWLCSKLKSSII